MRDVPEKPYVLWGEEMRPNPSGTRLGKKEGGAKGLTGPRFQRCLWGSMVAFPEKTGKEGREGHHAGENPRKNPKKSEGADQDRDLSGKPSRLRPTAAINRGLFYPCKAFERSQGPTCPRRRFPSEDPSLLQASLAGPFRGYPRSLRRRCKYPNISAFLEGILRDVLLTTKHLSPHRGRFGTSETFAEKVPR